MTKLEQFEALVLSQQGATEPWAPVTDYSFEARRAIEGPHPDLICRYLIPCEDADVLDYGCGPGHLVALLRIAGIDAKGYEPNEALQGLESLIARPHIRRDRPPLKAVYDLVICREVLEHLTIRKIHSVVGELCKLSAMFVYVTTRFAKAPKHVLDVDTSDELDPTHMTMLTKPFLRLLFVLEGFKARPDLEQAMDHQRKGRVLVYERVP